MSASLSILMLSPQYRPVVGGYEVAAERLSCGLVERGHKVTVLAERRDPSWPRHESGDGVRVVRLWCQFRPGRHVLSSMVSYGWFLLTRGWRFDVWHVHQYGPIATLAVALGHLLRRPVMLKLASTGKEGIEQVSAQTRYPRLVKGLLRRVNALVALSRESEAEALAFGVPRQNVHVLGGGVDARRFAPVGVAERSLLRAQRGIAATGVVLFVGRLAEAKDVEGLLEAWRLAVRDLPADQSSPRTMGSSDTVAAGWKLVLVGDGPLRAAIQARIADARLESSVLLVGHQADVHAWMALSDIYVLSSRWEGLSNTMLEAMASGLPVVSTRVSGATETVEQTGAGVVVAVGAPNELAAAIVALAKDAELRARMGVTGRALVEDRYSVQAAARSYEVLYRRLAGASAHSDERRGGS